MPKRGSHKKSANNPTLHESWENMVDETDRGLVLIFHAMIDRVMTELLSETFASTGTDKDDIAWLLTRNPMPPLRSFYLKCKLLRAFGVIGDELHGFLVAFNTLRNRAAHSDARFAITNDVVGALMSTLNSDNAMVMQMRSDQSLKSILKVETESPNLLPQRYKRHHTLNRMLVWNCCNHAWYSLGGMSKNLRKGQQ